MGRLLKQESLVGFFKVIQYSCNLYQAYVWTLKTQRYNYLGLNISTLEIIQMNGYTYIRRDHINRKHMVALLFSATTTKCVPSFEQPNACRRLYQLRDEQFIDSQAEILALCYNSLTCCVRIIECRVKLTKLLSHGCTLWIQWVPSHVSIPGNEKAIGPTDDTHRAVRSIVNSYIDIHSRIV